jgi:membrane protein
VSEPTIAGVRSTPDQSLGVYERNIKRLASRLPIRSLWDLQGVPVRKLVRRTWGSLIADRVFGHAAELGFYFLFALFPTLFCASSILGLAARSANQIYDKLLDYLALVIPTSALGTILGTFNETAAASTSGKLTFSLIAALWSASVGISAIQDTLNDVYKIKDTRSYFKARVYAIALTVLLTILVSFIPASLLGGNAVASIAYRRIHDRVIAISIVVIARLVAWTIAAVLLTLSFAVLYYWAPDRKTHVWHWLTPGCTVGIVGWIATSLGFRAYLHFFNNYSVIYGSLGAVIILLMWFYTTGLMILLGAEINSEIEAAAAEKRLAAGPEGYPGNGLGTTPTS